MSTTPVNPIVEMLVDGQWVDVTPDCRQGNADSGGGFEISRGVPNEGNFAEPTQFNFTLNNGVSKAPATEGEVAVYSPANPLGPYFGLLGRNQRVRIGYDRRQDQEWNRTEVDGWGYLPDHVHADGTTILPGERWHHYGNPGAFDVASNAGTAVATTGFRAALLERQYRDVDVLARVKVSNRTSEFGIVLRMDDFILPAPSGLQLDGATGWGSTQGTVATDTGQFRGENTQSVRLTVTGAPTTATLATAVGATTMYALPDAANHSYYIRFWVRCTISATIRCAVSFYASNASTFLAQSTQDHAVTANTWTAIDLVPTSTQDMAYARINAQLTGSPAAGTQMWIQDPEVHDTSKARSWTVGVLPGGTDTLRVNKTIPTTTINTSVNLSANVVAGNWYWIRGQITGKRARAKFWADGDPQPVDWATRFYDDGEVDLPGMPRTGEVGMWVQNGSATMTVDSIQIDQWRAHTEIASLPQHFDLSRQDRWVPVQSRGILRRLGQGRKSLRSAVSLHLETYSSSSYGWWPLEADDGDSAANFVAGGQHAGISGLTFGSTDSGGLGALPGVSGVATLSEDSSYFNAGVSSHANVGGMETMLWFMRLPALPASEILVATCASTGTIRNWRVYVSATGAFRVVGQDRNSATIVDQNVAGWNGNSDLPTGCWIAFTLYLLQDGSNVDWALNHHRPGSDQFWTTSGTYAGSVGVYTHFNSRSSSVHTAAGNLQLTQVMHYAGDLPFVTYDFRAAAQAYDGEEAGPRALRLAGNAGIPFTTIGLSSLTVEMGPQLPNKLVELLEECAEADDGFVVEERDDFGLVLITRNSLWNRDPLRLDIDAGHLTSPLEGTPDDLPTRNDSTITRPGGSSRRAIKTSGTLNVNAPEDDPDGVGTYDEQKTINVGLDDLCGSHANWRVSRGTQPDPRYPTMTALMSATAYQADPVLAADAMGLDIGDHIQLANTEADYRDRRQGIQGYTELVPDIYEWRITWATQPNDVRRVGVVSYTARLGTESLYVDSDFDAGTDTQLLVSSDDGKKMVTLAKGDIHWPFVIEAAGVLLRTTMTGVVLNADADMETGTTSNWAAVGVSMAIAADTFDPVGGTYCMRGHAPGAGTYGIAANNFGGVVTAGQQYRVSGWVKTEIGAAVTLQIDWYSAVPAFLSTSVGETITTSGNVWTYFTGTATAPVSAAKGAPHASVVFAGATRMWIDNVRLTAVSSEAGDPQTIVVEQAPVNADYGVSGKVIPTGTPIKIVDATHMGWGQST